MADLARQRKSRRRLQAVDIITMTGRQDKKCKLRVKRTLQRTEMPRYWISDIPEYFQSFLQMLLVHIRCLIGWH
jgi:hypothetical protein